MADMRWSPEDWARLGARLRTAREQQGYSRKRLAESSSVSEKSIQLTEEGRVPTRWPKSIHALEEALGWAEGSAQRVLDGGDEEYIPTLFDNSSVAAGGARTAEWFDVERHGRSGEEREEGAVTESPVDLPPEIQEALPSVMFFGSNCVAHGAPEWLGAAYDNAVAALLKHLSGPLPESGRRSQQPRPALRMQDAAFRQSMQIHQQWERRNREGLRKLAEATGKTAEIAALGQMKGLRETLERAGKDLAGIKKLSSAAQTQALAELSQKLLDLTAYTKTQTQLVNPARQVELGENEDAKDSGTSDRPEGEDEG